MVVMEFVGGVILSMLSPFFPLVVKKTQHPLLPTSSTMFDYLQAAEKGVSTTVTGIVMATCEIVMVLLSPIYGNYVTGGRHVFLIFTA